MTTPTIRTYLPIEGVASAQGLDVSDYQSEFNWPAAKAAVPDLAFGVFRLTQGRGGAGTNSPDPYASHNHAAIRDAGLHRGAYHFLDPAESGAAQARYFVDTHDSMGLVDSDMLWLDNEAANGQSPQVVSACAGSFMNELEQLRPHNPVGVYTFINFAKEGNCQGLGKWPLWLAYPNNTAPVPPPPWVKWTFWQWGTRNGIDADAFNGTSSDLTNWIASFKPSGPAKVGNYYAHLTDGKTSLGTLASSRNEKVTTFLAQQAKIYADLGTEASTQLAALSKAVPEAGLTWFTVNP